MPQLHSFLRSGVLAGLALALAGCGGHRQYARVIQPGEKEMIGSHQAGQETFRPLIDEAVGKLLARHEAGLIPRSDPYSQVSLNGPDGSLPAGGSFPKMRVCFVGVENRTAEEIGDFKEQIYEAIDSRLLACGTCEPISRRYVDAGLQQTRLRPQELFLPDNLTLFCAAMHQQGQPFDYLLFAKLTSGTTRENKDYQRDYQLILELVDIRTGQQDKQSATLSKGYHHSWASRAWSKMSSFGAR